MKIILHSDGSGGNLLKKMPTLQSSHYFLMGCWALKLFYKHTIVMPFGTMNTRAAREITVWTLICRQPLLCCPAQSLRSIERNIRL